MDLGRYLQLVDEALLVGGVLLLSSISNVGGVLKDILQIGVTAGDDDIAWCIENHFWSDIVICYSIQTLVLYSYL